MAGKLCYGDPNGTAGAAVLSQSKSFCEGRQAQATGGLIGDNPHLAGSPDAIAWDAGFNGRELGDPKGCCAV